MFSPLACSRRLLLNLSCVSKSFNLPDFSNGDMLRQYAKKPFESSSGPCDGCRKALVDISPPGDPECPLPCEGRRKKKKGLLHKIKLRLIEGGTNFGTPFKRLQPKEPVCVEEPAKEPKALPPPEKEVPEMPEPHPGVQVSILGADTLVGQYVALLLKQCPHIKRLRLYKANDCCEPCRDMYNVVQDLQHIDTSCTVQAFQCTCYDLEMCLQNTDIVLMLESGNANVGMSFEKRFYCQAPLVKRYADAIAHECPKAFVIVCTTPVDCMVPLIAETFKETGWYDRRKLLGSVAVQEMRASTLAARALCLEPQTCRVPCVGGTEGEALVPLFSKAVAYFDFAKHNAEMMTDTVRRASEALSKSDCCCLRNADLSEAHAVTGLVKSVAHALLCQDIPRVSGFVETDCSQVISPARYMTLDMLLNRHGICKKFDIPADMSICELEMVDEMWAHLMYKVQMAQNWYIAQFAEDCLIGEIACQKQWHIPKHYDHVDECKRHIL